MASLSRIHLIGVVAVPPVFEDGACRFTIGLPEDRAGAQWLQEVMVALELWLESAREHDDPVPAPSQPPAASAIN